MLTDLLDPIADKALIMEGLHEGQIDLQGQLIVGSNYTFLTQLSYNETRFLAVYKPSRGEQPLWDFPSGTLSMREVAAFHVNEALGWQLVPPTIYRHDAPLGPGSLQFFIPHDPNVHYFTFSDEEKQRLRPVIAFDLLINNADRKGGHILRDFQDHFWLIDHGISFHLENKLRTIGWDFAGEEIPPDILEALDRLLVVLQDDASDFHTCLSRMLSEAEISALAQRGQELIIIHRFPYPSNDRRPFPWPPI